MNAGRVMGLRVGAGALIGVLLCAQPALADPAVRDDGGETVTRSIDISGLDLSSRAGAERLYREIAQTARSICWDEARGILGVERRRQQQEHARQCFDEAVDGALAQVAAKTGVDLERVVESDRFDYAGLVAWR